MPKYEQQRFKGQFEVPSLLNSPHGALALQLETQMFGDAGWQCSGRKPQSPSLLTERQDEEGNMSTYRGSCSKTGQRKGCWRCTGPRG